MVRRPSMVRMRKCSVHRKTYRYCCEFFLFTLLLLLLGLSFAVPCCGGFCSSCPSNCF